MSNDVALVGQDRQTFYAAVPTLSLADSATDVFTLTGAAGRRIRPVKLGFSGIATTAEAVVVLLIKRAAENTAGSFTVRAAGLASSRQQPAKGIVRAYSVNPTLGNPAVNMMAVRATFTTAAGVLAAEETLIGLSGQLADVELLSEQEVLAINFADVTVTGGILSAWICWTEEELV